MAGARQQVPELASDPEADPPEQLAESPAPQPATRRTSRYPAVAGAVASLWGLAVGLAVLSLLVLGVWILAPNGQGGAVAAWRGAGLAWLGAHQVPLMISGHPLTLLPLGAVIPALLILRRAGQWAGRIVPHPSVSEGLGIIVGGAVVYGTGAAGVAWLTAAPATYAVAWQAGLITAGIAILGLSFGVGSVAGWLPRIRASVPAGVWQTWLAGLAAFVGWFALGSTLVTATLIAQFNDVVSTLRTLNAGPVGEFGLTLLGIMALPTMSLWAAAIAVGGTVGFGAAGQLSALGGELGKLPALPVLASLPAEVPVTLAWVMVVVVVLGALAGRIRWRHDLPTLSGVLTSMLGVAGIVLVLTSASLWLASGSLGGGRLEHIGPVILPASAAAAGLVALGFALEAGTQALLLSWQLHQAEQGSTIDLRETASE